MNSKPSAYEKYKSRSKGRTKRYAYILSGVLLFFLVLTTYSQLAVTYPVLMPEGVSLFSALLFLLAMVSLFCDLTFISQAITVIFICIIVHLLRLAHSTKDLARKDVIIGITLNAISAIIMIIRSFKPVLLLFKFLF